MLRKNPTSGELTAMQARFVEEYPKDLNQTQAARRAGFKHPPQAGARMFTIPAVVAAVVKRIKERSEKTGIDAEWVLRQAVEVYKRVTQEIKPALHPKTRRQMKDEDGNALYIFDSSAALRALEIIGRHIDVGAFEDRMKIGFEHSLIERLNAGLKRVRMGQTIDADFEEVKPKPIPCSVYGDERSGQ